MSSINLEKIILLGRKRFLLLIMLLFLGIVLLSIGGLISKKEEAGKNIREASSTGEVINKDTTYQTSGIGNAEAALEEKLKATLQRMEGVGKVSVSLILKTSPQYEYAINEDTSQREIKEKDTNGGERVTVETNNNNQLVVLQNAGMEGQEAVVIKELKPEIEGVLVVAEGAENPYIKAGVSRAVQTILGIPAHQVSVWPMKKER
ncbi:MAG TPA: stage III sporulation protein AG [Peptococcaceae bacterium]|nr:MAG: Stage III sporulation protein AG [Clostridia bacterium 41_269]HBT20436.1 stage III sporulation protein AG [Peptococcaceae bacterium]